MIARKIFYRCQIVSSCFEDNNLVRKLKLLQSLWHTAGVTSSRISRLWSWLFFLSVRQTVLHLDYGNTTRHYTGFSDTGSVQLSVSVSVSLEGSTEWLPCSPASSPHLWGNPTCATSTNMIRLQVHDFLHGLFGSLVNITASLSSFTAYKILEILRCILFREMDC